MGLEQVALLVAGALIGGIVNGLTGFGTALTALGIWMLAIPPTAAASLAIICSIVSQLQTLHLVWRTIDWKRVLFFVVPGLVGVPLGTWLLPHIEPRLFKLGIGFFLIVKRIADRGYQRAVMVLLLISGVTLIWASW
jgi:uncharacterized membrane protein YfcA